MAMYHANHPNGNYEIANRVEVLNPPHAISWKPGHDPGDGNLLFGGWIWRYDLAPLGFSFRCRSTPYYRASREGIPR